MKLASLATALSAALLPSLGLACSVCGCGDYSITVMGIEKPYAGRLRTALDYSISSEAFGEDVEHHELDTQRTTLGLSWSPVADATLAVQLPYVRKRLAEAGTQTDTHGFGDADLTARAVLYRDSREVPHQLAGLRVGLRLPTSQQVDDASGALADIDAQPGAGALTPSLGAWYGYYDLPVLVSFSTAYLFSGHGRQQFDPGDALVGSLSGQYGLGNLAIRLGLDGRRAGFNQQGGIGDPDSGGTLVSLAPGLAYRFGSDFLVDASVQVPVVKRLNGVQEESASWRLGVAWDLR